MLGTLNDKEMIALLSRQITGHLACSLNNESYIVPINYVYKDGIIYAHSGAGKKLEIMRQNPNVCFGVSDTETIFRWKSVICRGIFKEIADPEEKQQAMQLLTHRIMPFVENPNGHTSHGIASEHEIGRVIEPVVYKIVVQEMTGRFEHD